MKDQFFDKLHHHLMRPQVTIRGRKFPAWGLFFSASVIVAVASVIPLAAIAKLPVAPLLIASTFGVASLFVLAFATKIVTGREVYNFHHYLFGVMLTTGVALSLLGQPVLRNLDVIIIGIGVSYGCGRYACVRGGCCYGRPFNWGIWYPREYVEHGFPVGLVGVKLFPSQFVESLWMWLTIAVGVICLWRAQAGAALAWFVVMYSVGRFFSDFFRLEAGLYFRGFSEAQLASVVMTCVVFGLELFGWLPWQPVHAVAALLLVVVAGVKILRSSEDKALLDTDHVIEIANAIKRANRERPVFSEQTAETIAPRVEQTSRGLLISAGTISTDGDALLRHYCISRKGMLQQSTAQAIAKLIWRLCGRHGKVRLVNGPGVFHIVIPSLPPQKQNGSGGVSATSISGNL